MKLSELMQGKQVNKAFTGQTTADDMVLAVNLNGAATGSYGDYIVAQVQINEHSGSLDAQTVDTQYIRAGEVTTKTGTTRTITVSGDRYVGDEFQDMLLSHDLKYGTGAAVRRNYVYFSILNGAGEAGEATVVVEDDAAGAAGENLTFSATLTSTQTPTEYAWA
ncbi:MAG: hypothetical protein FWE12_00715 [Oscillospiraceae bacterium]|nr:hypothetical protein [Oscillospiraceae bacterium]